jgi:hypothetical protein
MYQTKLTPLQNLGIEIIMNATTVRALILREEIQLFRTEGMDVMERVHTDDHPFHDFIADRIIATQIDLLRLLADSGGVNLPNGGVNPLINNKNGGVNSMEQQIIETLEKMPGLNAPALATALVKSLRNIQRMLKN